MKTLNEDDFNVGMTIVGLGRGPREAPVFGGFMEMAVVGTMQREDNSYRGELYRVEAVDFPFIVIRKLCSSTGRPIHPESYDFGPRNHDLRQGYKWAEPSPEFIAAAMSLTIPNSAAGGAGCAKDTGGEQ